MQLGELATARREGFFERVRAGGCVREDRCRRGQPRAHAWVKEVLEKAAVTVSLRPVPVVLLSDL